ncbi:MAG: PolC-type DNA polymerase III [Bacilli bacterium]
MDEKLLKLLKHLEVDSRIISDDSFLVTYKDSINNVFTFEINTKELIDENLFKKIYLKCLEKRYILKMKCENIDYNKLRDYINVFYNNLKFTINSNKVTFVVDSLDERNSLNQIIIDLKKFLYSSPFEDIDINIVVKKEISKEEGVLIGNKIYTDCISIKNVKLINDIVSIEGYIANIELFESSKSNFKIITLVITDDEDSIYGKIFCNSKQYYDDITKRLKIGEFYKFKGLVKDDKYARELVININDINYSDKEKDKIIDTSLIKRVELHTHSNMSNMDGTIKPKKLIEFAKELGHKAVAITDHNSVQSFPEIYNLNPDIKVLYGVELSVIDEVNSIIDCKDKTSFIDTTFVVFDTETTGFNATGGDQMIEIGAVKLKNGEIIDEFSKLIDPKRPIPKKITEITKITDEMVIGMQSEEEVVKEFLEFVGNDPLVAHNATFDMSFLNSALDKYNINPIKNIIIDTLMLSRLIDSNETRHSLSYITKRYNVSFDEKGHHRASYDAKATAIVLNKMFEKLENMNISTLNSINGLLTEEKSEIFAREYHVTAIARNNIGLKNLFKLVSLANTKYLNKVPKLSRKELDNHREGLLYGSSCSNGEVFKSASSKDEEEMKNIIDFYDYIEIQPLEVYDHLVQNGSFESVEALKNHVIKIINIAQSNGKIVVATSDAHHLKRSDKLYREIIVNQKVPIIGRHPLNRNDIKEIPSMHFRTTDEMLSNFNFLPYETAEEIVINSSIKIADMCDDKIVVIKNSDKPFAPKMENSAKIVEEMTFNKARSIYGENLPSHIENRIKAELKGIIDGGFDVIYLIAHKLVKKSNDDGYLVGSRGSVGSSIVATFLDITEVNPLEPHYVCPNCKHSIFNDEYGHPFSNKYSCGYDMEDKICSCETKYKKDGHNIPFSSFLGYKAEKVPDIDLNFSNLNQAAIHDYTKELFGEKNVFRAGTISTVADKTAYGFIKGYFEEKNIPVKNAHISKIVPEIVGIKRTTGQHPGGIVVVPDYTDVFEFTPYGYPADDKTSSWYTTHFDYHAIDLDLLKLDLLGHLDPTAIRMLCDLTGVNSNDIPFDDKEVLSIFNNPTKLGVTKEDIMCETGSLGIPEHSTFTTINMLIDVKPKSFSDLVKISGLAHGTNVWNGNQRELLLAGKCTMDEVFGCREDIIAFLTKHGTEPFRAFKIMEFVRKGKARKDKDAWNKMVEDLKDKVPNWYLDACGIISYLFPKAHATAYIMMAYRVAFFKLYYKHEFYATYFSIRANEFDVVITSKGKDAIKSSIEYIEEKGYDATVKENALKESLHIALEATHRGVEFGTINLYKSHSSDFVIDSETKKLIPPFNALDGLGNSVAEKIIQQREKGKFLSIEDLKTRCKVSTTLIEKLRELNVLDGMLETNQLTLDLGF